MPARWPIPKNVTFVTFDVYGTLIDWETGIYDAFAKEAARDGFEIDRNVLIPLFHEISREIEGGSYELYAEVLRRTAIEIAKRLEWPLEPSRSGFLPDSVQRWKPFKETNTQLQKLAKKYKLGLLSNIDDKLLGQTRRHIPIDFDLVVTAQQVRSYKPEPAHFTECARRIGGKRGWVHVAASHYHDVAPCVKQRVPVIWVNRNKETLDSSQKKPTAEVTEPQRGRQAARRHLDAGAVRALSLHRDVHRRHQRAPAGQLRDRARRGRCRAQGARERDRARRARAPETFVIDSPVLPEELELLPSLVEQAGFPAPQRAARDPRRLGPPARSARLPRGAARLRREHRARACSAEPGAAQRELRDFDEELLLERPRPAGARLAPGAARARAAATSAHRELELHPTAGHTADGMASGSPGRACSSPATTSRRSRSRRSNAGGDGRGLPRDARAPAPAASSRPSTWCPATGRCWTRERALAGARGGRAYLRGAAPSAAPRPSCRERAAARRERARSQNVAQRG